MQLLSAYLLFVVGILGATDIYLYHSISHGIRQHEDSKIELIFHSLRGPTYAALFAMVPIFEFHGVWCAALLLLLLFDIGISIADFWVEEESRRRLGGLPSGEYVLHMIIAMCFGAFVLAIALQAPEWLSHPTKLVTTEAVPLWLKAVFMPMAALVFYSGLQDARAAWRLFSNREF